MKKIQISLSLVFTLLLTAMPAQAMLNDLANDFIDEMVRKHDFDREQLKQALQKTKIRDSILKAISRPAEKRLTWGEYQKIFLQPKRVEGGVKFWKKHEADLKKAEKEFGVPPEIITAIIGVETLYGKRTGGYQVLEALATLGFHYPPRAKFFRSELKHFLLLTREEKMDPLEATGSYAGAMGTPQFIPSSYRHYAIDFDGDGKRDIWNNPTDVIGSVANYFSVHHWRPGEPVTVRVTGVSSSHDELVEARKRPSKPNLSIARLRNAGINVPKEINSALSTNLIELEGTEGTEHWAGLKNFYVITRYNHSNLYAMAVYQLSQQILEAYQKQQNSSDS